MGGSDEAKFDHPTQKPLELMRRVASLARFIIAITSVFLLERSMLGLLAVFFARAGLLEAWLSWRLRALPSAAELQASMHSFPIRLRCSFRFS
jgi:hypothetical protein